MMSYMDLNLKQLTTYSIIEPDFKNNMSNFEMLQKRLPSAKYGILLNKISPDEGRYLILTNSETYV